MNLNEEFLTSKFIVTERCRKLVFETDKFAPSDEFWDLYPGYIYIDGKKIPAKSTNKEDFQKRYYQKIGKHPHLHADVMKALKYAVDNGDISSGIVKWFESEQWNVILKEMERKKNVGRFPNEKVF